MHQLHRLVKADSGARARVRNNGQQLVQLVQIIFKPLKGFGKMGVQTGAQTGAELVQPVQRGGAAANRVRVRRVAAGAAETDVERLLIWAYQKQRVHMAGRGEGEGIASLFMGAGNGAAMDAYLSLGCCIDTPDAGTRLAAGSTTNYADPVAEAVHACVLGVRDRGLVIQHAQAASRPDWMPGVVIRCVPVLNKRGKPTMEYANVEKSRPLYCYYTWTPCRPEHLALARGLWVAWWDAVETVRIVLGRQLRRSLTGPREAREPWVS